MKKDIVTIKCCKCLLVFESESELLNGLKPEILKKALIRGKGYRRAASNEKRQAQVN